MTFCCTKINDGKWTWVPSTSLSDTFRSKRKKKLLPSHEECMKSNRQTAKLSRKWYSTKKTDNIDWPREPKPHASEKRWRAPSRGQVGNHQEAQVRSRAVPAEHTCLQDQEQDPKFLEIPASLCWQPLPVQPPLAAGRSHHPPFPRAVPWR